MSKPKCVTATTSKAQQRTLSSTLGLHLRPYSMLFQTTSSLDTSPLESFSIAMVSGSLSRCNSVSQRLGLQIPLTENSRTTTLELKNTTVGPGSFPLRSTDGILPVSEFR